jgi:hypothetical protein
MKKPWTTHDELHFVAHLSKVWPPSQRKWLLMGYLAGFRQRMNWEVIDSQVVREAAERALEGLK